MAIYRGPGGPGDATTDAASEAALVSTLVTQAQTAATNAASSSSSASTSASNASTSATNAANSATNAANSATSAAASLAAIGSSEANAAASASAAATSATNAANSATSAGSSATSATASASAASSSASAASTSASNAASSASSASTSASNAATSATNAANSYDSFDDRYLGAKATAPTLDNDGDALLTGALYWNTVTDEMFVWDGTQWVTLSGGGGDVVSDTTPQLGGALDTNGYAINFGDNDKATFGDSEDLWLYHDGGSSYLFDRGTGNLRIITNSTVSIDGVSGGEFMAQFVSNGAVSLYYDNSNKFQTTSTGINVNGNITVSGTVDGVDIATGATNWNTAYGWGDHASAGYLDSADIGVTVQAYDSNLTSFVTTFTLPTTDGTNGQVLQTNGSGTLSFTTPTGGGITTGKAIAMAIVFG